MKPEANKLLSGLRLRLRNFIFMVRKNQVFAASVQVEAFAELLHGHDRALNVPARAAGADAALPKCLVGFGRFP